MKKLSHKEIEKEEEETGIDLDHDGEKGESKKHKDKIKKARLKRFGEWLSEVHPELNEAEIAKDVEKARKEPGGSDVGKARKTSGPREGPFCGPSGSAPKGSFPVTSAKQGRAAKAYAHNAPNPEGIKKCVDRVLKNKD